MKRVLAIVVLLAFMAVPSFAGIGKVVIENKVSQDLSTLKRYVNSDTNKYTKIRQGFEDNLDVNGKSSKNLDSKDKENIGKLPVEIQKIVDALNNMDTILETYYGEVE